MFDAYLRAHIDKPLNHIATWLVKYDVHANAVTWVGFTFGVGAAFAVYFHLFNIALLCVVVNRVLDGLDGAVARLRGPTDYGGYLDIVLDFIFYSAFPFSFILADPISNGLAGSFLIFSFVGTGGSFLAFAIFAEKRKISTEIRGKKSFYYLGGLTEGAETILLFLCLCLFPNYFSSIAWVFGSLCWITTIVRIRAAKDSFN